MLTLTNMMVWHSFHGNIYWNTQNINPHTDTVFEIYAFEIETTSPKGQ